MNSEDAQYIKLYGWYFRGREPVQWGSVTSVLDTIERLTYRYHWLLTGQPAKFRAELPKDSFQIFQEPW